MDVSPCEWTDASTDSRSMGLRLKKAGGVAKLKAELAARGGSMEQ